MLQSSSQRPSMPVHEFDSWRRLVKRRCGLDLTDTRKDFLERRLWRRMSVLGMRSYGTYQLRVAAEKEGKEWQKIQASLLNHETRFFRHGPSFEALTQIVLPELRRDRKKQGTQHLSLWSAGCSSGEELYSMGICALDSDRRKELTNLCLLGTDLSPRALEVAKVATYAKSRCQGLSSGMLTRHLEPADATSFRVAAHLKSRVYLRVLNLLDSFETVPLQDVIFCQNVLIYLDRPTRLQVAKKLCGRLAVGGYLFLAPAEIVGLQLDRVESVRFPECSAFRKVS